MGSSPHHNAVSWRELCFKGGGHHRDSHAGVLHKKEPVIPAVVSHSGLEGHGQQLAGFGIA